jgi:two-component system KDP operon response regulator KdpE
MASEGRVLVVDDDAGIRKTLELNLRARGYTADLASTGEEALVLAARNLPDLVIVDLGLPGIEGLDVIRGIRGWTPTPIIVLSGRDAQAAKVEALDLGADDYVTKPFGMDELFARMRVCMRRGAAIGGAPAAKVVTPDFTIDFAARTASNASGAVHLTPRQWKIVEVLVRSAGRLVTHEQILREVWGPGYGTERNYLRVFMTQIRQRLEPQPSRPRYFITEPGSGFRFEPPSVG